MGRQCGKRFGGFAAHFARAETHRRRVRQIIASASSHASRGGAGATYTEWPGRPSVVARGVLCRVAAQVLASCAVED